MISKHNMLKGKRELRRRRAASERQESASVCWPSPANFLSEGQQMPPAPAGTGGAQIWALVTKPSASTVVVMLWISTATGVSSTDGMFAPPVIGTVVCPLIIDEVPVPLLIAATNWAVAIASLLIAL